MKTKLLKKVRQRYSIIYYPRGFSVGSGRNSHPCVVLKDHHKPGNSCALPINSFQNYKQCRAKAYNELMKSVRNQYAHTRQKARNPPKTIIWGVEHVY